MYSNLKGGQGDNGAFDHVFLSKIAENQPFGQKCTKGSLGVKEYVRRLFPMAPDNLNWLLNGYIINCLP